VPRIEARCTCLREVLLFWEFVSNKRGRRQKEEGASKREKKAPLGGKERESLKTGK
jgi:hypothetical protein